MTSEATPPRPLGERSSLATYRFDPHNCFACGDMNEHGLRLPLHVDARGSTAIVTLDSRFQGWESVAHGGIASTILDEMMVWAVVGRGSWGVTARLTVAFRRPIPIGRELRAEGWVTDDRRRALKTAGRIVDVATGEVLTTAEAIVMTAPSGRLGELRQLDLPQLRARPSEDPEAGGGR